MMNPVCVKLPTQSSITAVTPVGMCSGENQLLDLYDANNMPLTTYYRFSLRKVLYVGKARYNAARLLLSDPEVRKAVSLTRHSEALEIPCSAGLHFSPLQREQIGTHAENEVGK